MLTRLIQWSLGHRPLVLGLSLLLLALGFDAALRLPVEVLPDLTKPTVTILTESPGLAPEEVEAQVTQPIENALMGVAGLTRLRSNSDVALSLIYAEFDWNTDIHRARVLVQERLQSARERLPEGTQPYLTPVASLMGEILLVGVRSTVPAGEPGHLAPAEVRTLADWTLRSVSTAGLRRRTRRTRGCRRRRRRHHDGRTPHHRTRRDHGAQPRHDHRPRGDRPHRRQGGGRPSRHRRRGGRGDLEP
jgi:Cu/Ag efflux pump CusA